MRKILLIIAAMAVSFQAMASDINADKKKRIKPNGEQVTKTYRLKDFTSLVTSSVVDIDFIQSDNYSVELVTSSNLLDIIQIEKAGDRLVISTRDGYDISDGKDSRVRISAPVLSKMEIAGASDIDIRRTLRQDGMTIVITGAGDIEAESLDISGKLDIEVMGAGKVEIEKLKAGNVDIEVKGAGEVEIEDLAADKVASMVQGVGAIELGGRCGSATYRITGAGAVNAKELRCQEVEAQSSGVGSITCWAERRLKASANGISAVRYRGNPSQKDIDGKGVRVLSKE